MATFQTFKEIYTAVEDAVTQSGSKRDLVKSAINMVYLNEILQTDDLYPLFWLQKMDDSLNTVGPATITGITLADPGVITTDAAHGLVVNNIVSIYQILGTTELNNRTFKVATVPTTTSLTLIDVEGLDAIDTSSMTAWTSAGIILFRGFTLATSGVDVENILQVSFHDYRLGLDEISIKETEESAKWWDENTTRPTKYMHRKFYSTAGVEINQLWLFPGADAAYDMRYWVEQRVARLSADGDVPQLPPQFHDTLIAGAITRLIDSNVQVENAVIWPGIYKMQLENLRTFNRNYYQRHRGQKQAKPYML